MTDSLQQVTSTPLRTSGRSRRGFSSVRRVRRFLRMRRHEWREFILLNVVMTISRHGLMPPLDTGVVGSVWHDMRD